MSDNRYAVTGLVFTGTTEILALDTVAWAIGHAKRRLGPFGIGATIGDESSSASGVLEVAIALGADAGEAGALGPEAYAMQWDGRSAAGRRVRILAGDAVGAAYGVGELAERIAARRGPLPAADREIERPAVPVRGIARSFASVDEDAAWFHDRRFWGDYLDHIAAQRFNRFHLALGMQFNYGTIDRGLVDNYLTFAYPFLVDVEGYGVRAEGVDTAERDRNLDALRFIARETRRRGIRFQLGLWTHAYAFGPQTRHRYPIVGISDEIHADYSAAALARLLAEVPEIGGLTFRVHFEAGIREAGQELFWDKIFAAISACGRPIEVDMHAKGVGEALLEAVRKPGIDPVLSGKYWAEHLGLPYHQTKIRARETARPAPPGETLSTFASYSRLFTRYGYADYLREDRSVDFLFRVWPGTQKLLLWGDPAIAAGYGRHSTIGGSRGVEFCEPLFFKGRKRGVPNGHDPYVRADLRLGTGDWAKYRYTYRLWGRLLYNPDADPEVWRRLLREDYGAGAEAVEQGLAALSRILPLVTVVHGVGGANNIYWPELYVDLPVSSWVHSDHYDKGYEWDDSAPQNWGRVSPFDPAMFYAINEYARDVVACTLGARYTPLEVAAWIDRMVAEGEAAIATLRAQAEAGAPDADPAQRARTLVDMEVLARLGRFFAGKFRAAVEYALFETSGEAAAMARAVAHLETARDAYAGIAAIVDGVYGEDLVFGTELSERGHWSTRVRDIDADLRALRLERDRAAGRPSQDAPANTVVHRTDRPAPPEGIGHTPRPFDRGQPLDLALSMPEEAGIESVVLHYRHLDQSKPFQKLEMSPVAGGFEATIPGDYLATTYPLHYYFELGPRSGPPLLHPGLDATLSNQPYFVIHSTARAR